MKRMARRAAAERISVTWLVVAWLAFAIAGCGGGGGRDAGDRSGGVLRGVFLDTAVEGLTYRTDTRKGTTDAAGTFVYKAGEQVRFSVGGIPMGSTPAKPILTPLDLVAEAVDERHPAVINIARLLQALDDDGDIEAGIRIPSEVGQALKGSEPIDFDQPTESFSQDPRLQTAFVKLNAAGVFAPRTVSLGSAEMALAHLQNTLRQNPTITVMTPASDTAMTTLDPVEITWRAPSFIELVGIWISLDDGATWESQPLVAETANDGSHLWDPLSLGTTLAGRKVRIRIVSAADDQCFADSAGHLVIEMTLGVVADLILSSTAGDADFDHLPDDVEALLGTDPTDRDSDHDGIFDYNEVFPSTSYSDAEQLVDADGDGLMAALDPDEDGDGQIDGLAVDTDGDGIPNYLEYYGYTYDWFSDSYALWDGVSYDQVYFKTDPLQPSTDQDPYSDAMEASGRLMDVLIKSPGDLPMVPAYPNILVRLEGFDVTLNAEITYADGGSLAEERNWSRQTTVENAFEMGLNWQVGATGKIAKDEWAEFSASIGGSMSFSHTTGSSRSTGGSVTKQSNWEKAVSSNPAEAAHIKLKLKVTNIGTAAASNILPTLTLKIGGMSVATFKPSDPINILEPGGTYPAQTGTYWVVERTDSGEPLTLTLDELRALECGAPINIALTQLDGEVMLMGEGGNWENAGAWSEYIARCEAVCANIKLDLGDGNLVHHLVYADDAATAPRVTLGDALSWIAAYDKNADHPLVTYTDGEGLAQTATLSDWNFIFDLKTLSANGIVPGVAPEDADFAITDLLLGPDTVIIARAPRETVGLDAPEIYYAYFDVKENLVKLSAGDYNGIASAEFIDHCDRSHPMDEVLPGSGMYLFDTSNLHECDGTGAFEPIYADEEGHLLESVRVTSNDGIGSEPYSLTATYVPEREPGLLKILSVSIKPRAASVDVTLEFDPYFPPSKVYFIHPDLDNATHELTKHPMYWHPDYWNHWTGSLPDGWTISADELAGMWVVAEVDSVDCEIDETTANSQSATCFASYIVQASDVRAEGCDSGTLNLSGYWSNVANVAQTTNYHVVDFTSDNAGSCQAQVDYITGDEVLWSGHNYDAKYDLALLPQGIHQYLVARHGYMEILDRSFEQVDEAYIRSTLTGAAFGEGIFYTYSGPLAGSYNDTPANVWVLKAGPGGEIYIVVKIKWTSGTSYVGHTRHHAELSYVIYDLSQ